MIKNIIAGITIGDPNGIGPEIILKAFCDKSLFSLITPIIYCPYEILSFYQTKLNTNFSIQEIKNPKNAIPGKINIIPFNSFNFKVSPGKITKAAGEISFLSLKNATNDLFNNLIHFIVTAPINKDNIQNKDFNFFGHTEYFTKKSGLEESLMLMVHDGLKVGLVTNHLPVHKVAENITKRKILQKLTLMSNAIKADFDVYDPKIAILGLNPHAGDNGLIGKEDISTIQNSIDFANKQGIKCFGPFPADGFFANEVYKKYDGVLAMYHDQGLIPFKVISKNKGVNFTAGLPIVRTSPDHGTGYDIAGKGKASSISFKNSIIMGEKIYQKRKKI